MTENTARPPATLRTDTMPAWRQDRYGGPEVVALADVDVPAPRRGEVLLRLRATGLNNGDVRVLRGEPLLLRIAFGLRRPRQAIRGMDAAATVVAIGEGVSAVAVGDEVVGELPQGGGLARYAVSPASRLVPRPIGLDPVIAAALPVAGGTAWQALERGRLTDAPETVGNSGGPLTGRRVLVIGASGGVGTFAVQLAALRGAEVWALCGQRNRALVESLGAARTFDYRTVDLRAFRRRASRRRAGLPGAPELEAGSFDVVIDIAGTAPLQSLQALVRDGGSVVLVSGEGGRVVGPIGRILRAGLLSIGSKRPLRPLAATAKSDVLTELVSLAAAGRLRPVIEHTYAFADAGAALAHLDTRHAAGKLVVAAG